MTRSHDVAPYFPRYSGRVHRVLREFVGVANDMSEVTIPAGALVQVVGGFYATDDRPVVPQGEDDHFRMTGVLLTPGGADDPRGISYDGFHRSDLVFEPGIVDWTTEDSAQAVPQGWDIFLRDSPNNDGECWELQAVLDEDRFETDEEAMRYVRRRAVEDFDPLARRALAFLYHRAPAEYRRAVPHDADDDKPATPEIPAGVRDSLEAILGYNWDDERDDAEAHLADDGTLENHVFIALVDVRNWLDGTDRTPESYLDAEEDEDH